MTVFNNAESRSQFIQPIRELSKNWDVDVASRLEEYLAELEEVQITFDGSTTMNFAEAALLIQSSTCVYSKKVEHLYNLVYQALDMVTSKKKLQQAGSANEENADDGDDLEDQDEFKYLDLDDFEGSAKIELKEDESEILDENMNTFVRTPSALLGVEESEKVEKMLLSCKGEMIGSRMDYWMNRTHLVSFTAALCALSPATNSNPNLCGLRPVSEENEVGEGKVEANGLDVNAELGIPLADVEDDDFDAGEAMPFENGSPDQPQVEENRRALRERKGVDKLKLQGERRELATDPWKTVDAYDNGGLPEKPFKKGKTFKIPAILQNKKRKRNDKKVVPKMEPIDEFVENAFYSHKSKCPKNPLKIPIKEEFLTMFYTEYKLREKKIQEKRKLLKEEKRIEELKALEERLKEEKQDELGEDNVGQDFDDDDDFGGGGFGFGAEDPDLETIEPMRLDVQSQQSLITESYEDLVKKHVEMYLDNAQQYIQETELSKCIKEWEEKMQPKLQAEEDHGPFDIHRYGSVILDSFEEKDNITCIPFMEITKNKKPYEISRLFLASLQLANNRNVDIGHHGDGDNGMDDMLVTILSKQRHHEELAEYKAPSLL